MRAARIPSSPGSRALPWAGLCTLALFLATSCTPPPPQAERGAASEPVFQGELQAGWLYEGSLERAAIERYSVRLAAGDSLLLEVAQDEVDLVVRISDPDGREILLVDSPTGTMAPERVCVVSDIAVQYAVDVAPYADGGAYSLTVLHVRPATDADRKCARAASDLSMAQNLDSRAEKVAHAESAGRLWEAAGEPFLAAVAWRQVAALQLDGGATSRAIAFFDRALSRARESGNIRLEVSILNRLGLAHLDADDLPRAAKALDQALALARDDGDPRGEAAALTNRGLVDEEMGEPHRAVDRYREALQIWRREDEPAEIAQALNNLADVLGVLDHHDEALDALDEALQLARRAGDLNRQANVLTSMGWVHYLRGEPSTGLAPLREARALRRENGDAKGEAGVLDRLGTVLLAAGEPRAAEDAYRASLRISEQMDLPGYRAATQNNLGCLLAGTERSHEAAGLLAATLDYFQGSNDPKSWSQVGYCLARLARHQGRGDDALDHVRRALAIVESLRETARAAGHHYKPIWLWQDYAELELSLLLDRYRSRGDPRDLAEAFAAADQMRARTLYELVVLTRSGAERAAGRAFESRADRIQAQLSALAAERSTRLAAAESRSSTTELDAEIRRLRLALEQARAEIRAAARHAGQLGTPRSVSAAEAQRLLDPHTVLLTYVLGAERSHLLALTRDRLTVFELAPRQVLERYAEGLYHALKESRRADGQWRLVASALGRLLLPPAAVPADVERLLVSPEGALLYVPFTVLASPRTDPEERSAVRLVLDDFEVVSIPSAAVLAALRSRRQAREPAARTVAVFADPVFSGDDPRVREAPGPAPPIAQQEIGAATPSADRLARGIVAERLPEGPLPRLPATAAEAAAILARVPPDQRLALLGPEVTKQAVLAADLRAYRILHFATHAWVDERFPELSGLVLSTVDRAGREIDGALYLHEIDRLDLAADLTVLSGCQTALGRRVRGDGLLGLTQGFFHAGSSQVLVSLWSLDDIAAARLMDELYRRMLDGGEPPATALRHAQQWLRRQEAFQAPRFWAPFVLQGDG